MSLKSLTDEEVKALLPHTGNYSVGILRYPSQSDSSVGSGTLVRIGAHFFVATAAHNLIGFTDESLYVGCTRGFSSERLPFTKRSPLADEAEPPIDVGYIEFSTEVAHSIAEKDFLPLNRVRPFVNSWPTRVFLTGIPAARIPKQPALSGRFYLPGMGYLTETLELEQIPYEQVDKSRDICVSYDEKSILVNDNSLWEMGTPHGISGGGLWALPLIRKGAIWTPQGTMLIGIERSWLENSRIVFCTQMQHWLGLVADDYPDLRELIASHLAQYGRGGDCARPRGNWGQSPIS